MKDLLARLRRFQHLTNGKKLIKSLRNINLLKAAKRWHR